MQKEMPERKFGNRRGPTLDLKDVMKINDLYNRIMKIFYIYDVAMFPYMPKKHFELHSLPKSWNADKRGEAMMNFTLSVTRAAIEIISTCVEEYAFEVHDRPFTFQSSDHKAKELTMRYEKFVIKKVCMYQLDLYIEQIDFILKYIIPNNFPRRKHN